MLITFTGKGLGGPFVVLYDSKEEVGVLVTNTTFEKEGKLLPIKIYNKKLTEVPWPRISSKLFDRPIGEFKEEIRSKLSKEIETRIENQELEPQGVSLGYYKDLESLEFGPGEIEERNFKDVFFSNVGHESFVSFKNESKQEIKRCKFKTARGSFVLLEKLLKPHKWTFKVQQYSF